MNTPLINQRPSLQDWRTPGDLWLELSAEFGPFTLDAAASAANARVPRYYSELNSGLDGPWDGIVWCNPPYRHVKPWVLKAVEERAKGVNSVLLLPAATDTEWFEILAENSSWWLTRGRVRFVHPHMPNAKSPPGGSVIAHFHGNPCGFRGFRSASTGKRT